MNEEQWRAERDDRPLRYPNGRVLDPKRRILLRADLDSAVRYDGQVEILTLANLLGRMTPAVGFDIPDVPIVAPLPWAGDGLRDFVWDRLQEADPYGRFEIRSYRPGDYVIQLGASNARTVVHGSGWNAYVGPAPSPLHATSDFNPIGPAFAAILAATELCVHEFVPPVRRILVNTLDWTHEPTASDVPCMPPQPNLGELWTVGTGSVGTAILYFLTLATTRFSATLFDMKRVKIYNLGRSPIFTEAQVGQPKVVATKNYLNATGVNNVIAEHKALDESPLWRNRLPGTPDALISAANERNVRHVIETSYPPVQVYGTTGRNWQSSVIRHIPLLDPCSCCLFPDEAHAQSQCATGKLPERRNQEQIDAALPFLSFAAGAMAAAEILKLGLPGYPFSPNRVVLNTQGSPRLVRARMTQRPICTCQHLSSDVHQQMIAGSRHSALSI